MVKHLIKNHDENTNWELATFVDFGFFVVAVFVSVDFDFEDDVIFRVLVDFGVIVFIDVESGFFVVAVFVSVDFDFEDNVDFRVITDLVVVCTVSFSCFISFSCSFVASKSKLKYKQALRKKYQVKKSKILTLPGVIIADNCE